MKMFSKNILSFYIMLQARVILTLNLSFSIMSLKLSQPTRSRAKFRKVQSDVTSLFAQSPFLLFTQGSWNEVSSVSIHFKFSTRVIVVFCFPFLTLFLLHSLSPLFLFTFVFTYLPSAHARAHTRNSLLKIYYFSFRWLCMYTHTPIVGRARCNSLQDSLLQFDVFVTMHRMHSGCIP